MSDLIDDFGDPEGGEPRQTFFARVAHLCPWVIGISGPIFLVDTLVWWPPLQWTALVVAIVWLFAMTTSDFHRGLARICLRCMQEVPADAPIRAGKRRYLVVFREAHRPVLLGTWRRPGYTAIVVPLLVFTSIFSSSERPWVHLPIRAFILWEALCGWIHHRYKPWCPWCKWGDGGDAERVPDPDPVETGTKS